MKYTKRVYKSSVFKLISGCTAHSCIYQSLRCLSFNCFSLWHNECQKVTPKHSFCIINHSIFLKGKDNYNKITVQNCLEFTSYLTNSRENNCLKTMYNIDLDDLLRTHSEFYENNLLSKKKPQPTNKSENSSSSWQINLFRAKHCTFVIPSLFLKSQCAISLLHCVYMCCSFF